MLNFQRAYRVNSLSLKDRIGLFAGDEEPGSIDTTEVPVGSVYFQITGTVWKRIGVEASAWVKLIAEEMMLLNLGLAMGADGWAHPLQLAGRGNQNLMVHDTQVVELLQQFIAEQKKTNGYLSLMVGERITDDFIEE
ncbi:MAG: hypothetical protein HQL89_09045 [Magnetococcales bacterium]|nr:hypothetical protein [Magnetococcales bacterium]